MPFHGLGSHLDGVPAFAGTEVEEYAEPHYQVMQSTAPSVPSVPAPTAPVPFYQDPKKIMMAVAVALVVFLILKKLDKKRK